MSNSVPHIAVICHVDDPLIESQAAIWTEACRQQMLRHVGPAWVDFAPPPGIFYYGSAKGIPDDATAIIGIVGEGNDPDAAGYHALSGQLVYGLVDMSRSAVPPRTLSHELCEMFGNPFLDRWVKVPYDLGLRREYARELCDPVQRNSYFIEIEWFGQKMSVEVADFLLPGWFDTTPGIKRTYADSVKDPFAIAPGGYQVAREGDDILYLPARGGAVARSAINRPFSRTGRISQGITVKRKEAP